MSVSYEALNGLTGEQIIDLYGEFVEMEDGLIRVVDPDDGPDDDYYLSPEEIADNYGEDYWNMGESKYAQLEDSGLSSEEIHDILIQWLLGKE